MIRLAVPPRWQATTCVVRDVAPEDLDRYFTDAERRRIDGFRREKRRAEWAASRLATKLLAVENGLCASHGECTVDSAYRRPALAIAGRTFPQTVSITHSEWAGAAALSERRIGADLQKTRPLAERATKFFLNDDEVAAWRETDLADSLIHFWSAKEAGYKLHSMPGWYRGIRIRIAGVRPDGLLFHYEDSKSRGTIETARLDDDYILALAVADSAA